MIDGDLYRDDSVEFHRVLKRLFGLVFLGIVARGFVEGWWRLKLSGKLIE